MNLELTAVWLILGAAFMGAAWVVLTVLFRICLRRPRSCAPFSISNAQELAGQSVLFVALAGLLSAGFVRPMRDLPVLMPLAACMGFCSTIPTTRGWFGWGKLLAEWRHERQWWRPLGGGRRSRDTYDRPDRQDDLIAAEIDRPFPLVAPQLLRLRGKLAKVDAQIDHPSTHPNQRAAARRARQVLLDKIAACSGE